MRSSVLVASLVVVSACGAAHRSPPGWLRDPSAAPATLTVGDALDACGAGNDIDTIDEPPGVLRAVGLECDEEDVTLELAREPRLFSADRIWPIERLRTQRVVRVGAPRDFGPWVHGIDVIDLGPLGPALGVERLPGTLSALRRWAQARQTTCDEDPALYFSDDLGTRGGHCTVGPVAFGSVTVTMRFDLLRTEDREPIVTSVELVASDPDAFLHEILQLLGGRMGVGYGVIRAEAGSVRITPGWHR